MAANNSDFWLDYVEKSITESRESRDKAAERLDTFLKWVWGIYTSVFALASIFDYLSNSIIQLILVVQPIIIIIIARFYCTLVSMPGSASADPAVVEEIKKAHKQIVQRKIRKLNHALIAAIISIVSLCVALIGYNISDPSRDIKAEIQQLELEKERMENYQDPLQSTIDSLEQMKLYYELQLQIIQNKEKYDSIVQQSPGVSF